MLAYVLLACACVKDTFSQWILAAISLIALGMKLLSSG
jgi:hypothetical protein